MRDAMADAAAVFEPEEVAVLTSALQIALRKLDIQDEGCKQGEIARLVHNLARSRIRLKKPMRCEANATEIANEAIELFTYLEEAPETVLAASRDCRTGSLAAERIIGTFPRAYRDVPVSRL